MHMKLSIVVPIYNVQDYIIRCMEGILHQDLEDYEVIAVDDGSLDRSMERLQEYLADHPEEAARVRIIRKENGGLSDARNAGIAEAKGEYLWFVDSDDTIAENCLGALYDVVSREDLDLLLFDKQNIDERAGQHIEHPEEYRNGKIREDIMSGSELFIELRRERLFYAVAQDYWIRRDILMQNGLTFYKGIHHEDELFTPQALHYAHRARYVSSHPYIRYIREGSITTSEDINKFIVGYGTAVMQLLAFGDNVIDNIAERDWLHEDIVSLAQIMLGERSKHREISNESMEIIREVKAALRMHGLRLGIPFWLYTIRNRLLHAR